MVACHRYALRHDLAEECIRLSKQVRAGLVRNVNDGQACTDDNIGIVAIYSHCGSSTANLANQLHILALWLGDLHF